MSARHELQVQWWMPTGTPSHDEPAGRA